MSILDDLEICPELADFAFQKDASSAPNLTISEDLEPQSDEESAEDTNMNVDEAPVADYFDGPGGLEDDDHFGGDFGGDNFGGDDDGDEHSNGSVVGDSNQNGEASGSYVPFDPRNTTNEQRSLLVSMDANSGMDYFDNDNSRNWAGPEHYKSIKKIFRRGMLFSMYMSKCLMNYVQRKRTRQNPKFAGKRRKLSKLISRPRQISL